MKHNSWAYDGHALAYTVETREVTQVVVEEMFKDAVARGIPSLRVLLAGGVDEEFYTTAIPWFEKGEEVNQFPYTVTVAGLSVEPIVPKERKGKGPLIL